MFEKCYCNSGLYYSKCCKPYIKSKKHAPTPEALMRSRYTAYVIHAIDYIVETGLTPKNDVNIDGIKSWSEKSKWLGLEIISSSESSGTVEFKAIYESGMLQKIHHEKAFFKKCDDRWFYSDGEIYSTPVTCSELKQGRNEYCACGSGRKFKHCCGK